MKFHTPIKMVRKQIPEKTLLYQQTQQELSSLGPVYGKVVRDFSTNFKGNFTCAGIYYDGPQMLVDSTKARCVTGALVDENQEAIKEFLEKCPEYALKRLPAVETVVTEFPYVNRLSYVWAGFKVYPQIYSDPAVQDLLINRGVRTGTLEVYKYGEGPWVTEYVTPIVKEGREYFLTTFPEPEMKGTYKNTKKL
jgi:hypothetical protein